ncbi:MAG: hypothetical protein SLRJCFUN_001573 [Candidatus Fervidibacter sp.]|jgi:hypothetical protein
MKAKALYCREGLPFKVLERVLWREDVRAGKPVRYRAVSSILRPHITANRFRVTVWLPVSMAGSIHALAALTRQWQRSFNGHRKPQRQAPSRQPAFASQSAEPPPALSPPSVGLPANGNAPKPTACKAQRKENDLPPLVAVVCQRCGRVVEAPPEWLSLARCSACGAPLQGRDTHERSEPEDL